MNVRIPFKRMTSWILAALLLTGCLGTPQAITSRNANRVSQIAAGEELEGAIIAAAFTPDGRMLVFGDMSGWIHLWNAQQAKEIKVLEGPSGNIRDLTLSADGKTVIALSGNWNNDEDFHKLRMWDIGSYEEFVAPVNLGSEEASDARPASALAMSPDGKLLALNTCNGEVSLSSNGVICEFAGVRLLDLVTGSSKVDLSRSLNVGVWALVFSPDGKQLAVGGMDGKARLFDLESGKEFVFIKTNHHTLDVAFSPDGKSLAVGLGDGTVHIFDVGTGNQSAVLTGHTEAVTSIAFHPDGNLLVSGSTDKTVRLWDIRTEEMLATLQGHEDAVMVVAFNPDGSLIASGGNDKTLRLWGVVR